MNAYKWQSVWLSFGSLFFYCFFFVCVCQSPDIVCTAWERNQNGTDEHTYNKAKKRKKNAIKTTQINISMHPDYYSICQLNEYKFRIHNSVDQILSDRFV